jgi:hypothetical protein
MSGVTYLILAGCLVVLGIMLIKCQKHDGFKPNRQEQEKRANELVSNIKHVKDGLTNAKQVMPWIDPVTYEDVRKLLRQNNYNKSTIMQVL